MAAASSPWRVGWPTGPPVFDPLVLGPWLAGLVFGALASLPYLDRQRRRPHLFAVGIVSFPSTWILAVDAAGFWQQQPGPIWLKWAPVFGTAWLVAGLAGLVGSYVHAAVFSSR